jgi:hypothetical protein
MKRDEDREFRWLLANLESIVPCPECRNHIEEYKKSHALPLTTGEFGEWIWKFHTAVNERLGKEIVVPWSPSIGHTTSITQTWRAYQKCIQESIQKGNVKGEAIRQWGYHLGLWISFH